MNVGTLKGVIAAYLQVDASTLVVGGVDLILVSLNNARRKAELFHDWSCSEVTAYGTATLGVGNWKSNMLLYPSGGAVTLKQPTTFYLTLDNGDLLPLVHQSKKLGVSLAKEYLDRGAGELRSRYNGDYVADSLLSNGVQTSPSSLRIFLHGNGGYTIEPRPTVNNTVVVDGYRWLADYAGNNDTDWFTEHGSEYLQWASIVELNHRVQLFVPQQEGNIAPPVKAADEALTTLVAYDNYQLEHGAFL
jgi:hypothetical protein